MCGSNSCMHSSAEETIAAEDCLLIYCKPVELYNILHRRALKNPLFLQRCLRYKMEERRRWRLQMTISLVSTMAEGVQTQDMFPLYFMLAKPLFDTALTGHSAVYHLIQSCVMTSFNEIETKSRADANFILPEINKFSLDAKAGKLTVLLVSFDDTEKYLPGEELSKGSVGGYCLWGKIPVESLCNSSERCVNLTWGHRVEMLSNVDMRPCYLEPSRFEEGSPITFQTGWNPGFMISKKVSQRHVKVNIAAKLVGEIEKSPYESFACKNIPSSTVSNIIRLRAGNVIFNYRDRNNMLRKTEVTEDFACPFCLVQCACFKGLRCHLISSHDLFNFEFWVTEECQAVNVSLKNDFSKSETIADGDDPKLLPFLFCSKSRMRRREKDTVQKSKNVYPLSMGSGSPRQTTESTVRRPFPNKKDLQNDTQAENNDSDIPNARECIEHVASNLNSLGVDPECVPSVSGSDPTALIMLPCAKSRKISLERSDSRNRVLLKKKRQFFHSHRAQPMTLDEVLSDRDSEDELDDDIADFEDRRMLDDFVDVTNDEKHLMHLWNSFVRKQRVLADGHVPWACEAFSKHHGQELVQAPPLLWCWRLFMIKLWNHSLVDARTMNNCNIILQEYQTQIR